MRVHWCGLYRVEVGYDSIDRGFIDDGADCVRQCDLDSWSNGRGAEFGADLVSAIDFSDKDNLDSVLLARAAC